MDFDSPSQGPSNQTPQSTLGNAAGSLINPGYPRRERELMEKAAELRRERDGADEGPKARVSARDAMISEAQSLRRRAALLEELAMTLPMRLSPVAEEALWDLVQRAARR